MVGFEFPEASLGVSGNVVKISKEWAVGLDSAALESVLALGGYNRQATLLCVHVEDWAARIDNEITQAGTGKSIPGVLCTILQVSVRDQTESFESLAGDRRLRRMNPV